MSGLPWPPLDVMKAVYSAPRFPSGRDVVVMVRGVVPEELNVAVTVVFELRVTVQLPVPVHPPPLHPANTEPEDGVAVKVTTVPLENDLEQLEPQLMPEGVLVTVPVPVPDLLTWSLTELPRENAGDSFGETVVGASPPQADAKIIGTMIPESRRLLIMCPPLLL